MPRPEQWRIVPSVPGVLVSDRGRFLIIPKIGAVPNGGVRHYSGVARRGSWTGSRYIFRFNGKTYKVARLVCEAFNGPPPFDGAVCMHGDEDGRNNTPTNLKWGTQKENLNAPGFIAYCRSRIGEASPTVKARRASA